jgi:hypothetical protein
MRRILFISIISFCFYKGSSQTAIQAGISALPVFDVLNLYPDNEISGAALSGNFGCFLTEDLGFGINPYYGQVSNFYNTDFHREKEELSLLGMNAYLRYYFISRKKFNAFAIVSAGFGNMRSTRTILTGSGPLADPKTVFNNSVLTFMAGAGVSYFLSRDIALELNIPYAYITHVAESPAPYYQTVVPTFGLQFYWNRKVNTID